MVEKALELASCDAAATGNCMADFPLSTSKCPFLLWARKCSINCPRASCNGDVRRVQDGVGVEIIIIIHNDSRGLEKKARLLL